MKPMPAKTFSCKKNIIFTVFDTSMKIEVSYDNEIKAVARNILSNPLPRVTA